MEKKLSRGGSEEEKQYGDEAGATTRLKFFNKRTRQFIPIWRQTGPVLASWPISTIGKLIYHSLSLVRTWLGSPLTLMWASRSGTGDNDLIFVSVEFTFCCHWPVCQVSQLVPETSDRNSRLWHGQMPDN
jgi:hypothetical protein